MSYVIPAPSHRLPEATRLGGVRLQVADLARSLPYYGDVLGFRVLLQAGNEATLAAYGDDTRLIELSERPGAMPARQHGRLGLYHYAVLLPDRASLARFVAHLAQIGVYAGSSDHGVSEAFYLRDPDGLGIEVYADRPRTAWPIRGDELAMTLDPIDMRSLLGESGNQAWTGMPPGTKIGHVHLHVGDLPEAKKFYHGALGFDEVARLPSALFLSAGGYHHHLGTNTWAGRAPRAQAGDAQLLEWRVILPAAEDVEAAGRALEGAGYTVSRDDDGWVAEDPWGTHLRVLPEGG